MNQAYLAIDLGAESGRVIAGTLADGRMQLTELHRFVHEPVWLPTGLHWDITGIWREIVAGLRKAAEWGRAHDVQLVSVGVDTWGVDWALVDKAGELVGLPHAYRDPRNQAAYEKVVAQIGAERIYQTTGIQFMALNTLYSLYAQRLADPDAGHSRSAPVHARPVALLAQRQNGRRGDDCLHEPDGRLPHWRLGSRAARRTQDSGASFATHRLARHGPRHDSRAACGRHRLADGIKGYRACVARHGKCDRRRPGPGRLKLVLLVERHLVAVGRRARRAVRVGRGSGSHVYQ